jgi:uncharacterized cupredoxin-like copper-binding protein
MNCERFKTLAIGLPFLLFTGCASVTLPELPNDHPANPNVPEAPLTVRSSLLELSQTASSVPSEEADTSDRKGMDHSKHTPNMSRTKPMPGKDGVDGGMDHSIHMGEMTGMGHSKHAPGIKDAPQAGHDHAHKHGESAAGKPGDPKRVDRTVKVTGFDTMRFEPRTLDVKPGETIRFVVSNAGKLQHEFVIGDDKEQREHAEMMKKMPDMKHEHDNAVSLAPGETKTLVWQFGKGGTLELACHIPGHYEAGMVSQVFVGSRAGAKAPAKKGMQDKKATDHDHSTHQHSK